MNLAARGENFLVISLENQLFSDELWWISLLFCVSRELTGNGFCFFWEKMRESKFLHYEGSIKLVEAPRRTFLRILKVYDKYLGVKD